MISVAAISSANGETVITLVEPVLFDHYAETEVHDGEEISMRG